MFSASFPLEPSKMASTIMQPAVGILRTRSRSTTAITRFPPNGRSSITFAANPLTPDHEWKNKRVSHNKSILIAGTTSGIGLGMAEKAAPPLFQSYRHWPATRQDRRLDTQARQQGRWLNVRCQRHPKSEQVCRGRGSPGLGSCQSRCRRRHSKSLQLY